MLHAVAGCGYDVVHVELCARATCLDEVESYPVGVRTRARHRGLEAEVDALDSALEPPCSDG